MKSLILAAALTFTAHSAFSFDLKGIEVGKAPALSEINHSLGLACKPGLACLGLVSLGGRTFMTMVQLRDGVVVRLSVDVDEGDRGYEALSQALLQKFGKPETEHSKVQTKFGASLDQIIMTWRNSAGDDAVLVRYVNAAAGALVIRSKAQIELEAAIRAKAKNDI